MWIVPVLLLGATLASNAGSAANASHAGHVDVAPPCDAIVQAAQPLRVRIARNALDPVVLEIAREEITAIWRPYRIEIIWDDDPQAGVAEPDLWVQFVDYSLPPKWRAPAIAWIVFHEGTPTRLTRVSLPAARALMRAPSWFDQRPMVSAVLIEQQRALGRIIGRTLAHEIGHYLLAVPVHAKEGLMHPMLAPEVLMRPDRHPFFLTTRDVEMLESAQRSSCELQARAGSVEMP